MSLDLDIMLLVLAAAVIHATWSALVKASGEHFLTLMIIICTGSLMAAMVLPVLSFPPRAAWPYLAAAFFLHQGYYLFMLLSYRVGDLNQVYPLARGIAPLVVAGLAAVFAGEVPNGGGVVGIGAVSVGIAGLAFSGGLPRGRAVAPIAMAAATGLCLGTFTVVDGIGVRLSATPWDFIAWLLFLNGLPMAMVALSLRRARLRLYLSTRWKSACGGGILSALGFTIVLYALGRGGMAHVAALRETSVLFAALIGSLMLHEPLGLRRTVAAAVIAIGLVVLQLSGRF
jgi:drug/metabolite transporter (DMT)-like permease